MDSDDFPSIETPEPCFHVSGVGKPVFVLAFAQHVAVQQFKAFSHHAARKRGISCC